MRYEEGCESMDAPENQVFEMSLSLRGKIDTAWQARKWKKTMARTLTCIPK